MPRLRAAGRLHACIHACMYMQHAKTCMHGLCTLMRFKHGSRFDEVKALHFGFRCNITERIYTCTYMEINAVAQARQLLLLLLLLLANIE